MIRSAIPAAVIWAISTFVMVDLAFAQSYRLDQSGLSYLQAPAGRMTCSRGCSRNICRKLSVAMSWLRTLPAAAAGSLREASRRPTLMATRS